MIDGSEWLKVIVDFLLGFAVVHEDHTAEYNKTVLRKFLVELKLRASRSNGSDDRLLGLAGLDILCLSQLRRQLA